MCDDFIFKFFFDNEMWLMYALALKIGGNWFSQTDLKYDRV